MTASIRFTLNGKPVTLETDPDRKLLWVLRTDLESTGTKYGCGAGVCGSCTVVIDGQARRSCLVPVGSLNGGSVTTIEGLARNGQLHPIQAAFHRHGGFQCGYCTPGMIMNAYGLLLQHPRPTRAQIVEGMDGNLCRCAAHQRIFQAIETASAQMGGDRE
jgi:aerobic-type carbon monoxide dehydrogenase small subunit (CoxS/CutS family)